MSDEERCAVIDECIDTVRRVIMMAPRKFTADEKAAFHMFRERTVESLNDLKDPDRD